MTTRDEDVFPPRVGPAGLDAPLRLPAEVDWRVPKCDSCRSGHHEFCTRPSEPIEGEDEGGLRFFRVCCCNLGADEK